MLKERYEDYTEQEFLIPASEAERLRWRWRSLASFDSFRRAFWREVRKEGSLTKEWTTENIELARNGKPP